MHLVNWDVVKRPFLEGGLEIKDPTLVNLARGGKLLWKLFSYKNHPVSQIFWKKYLKGGSLRNLQLLNSPIGSISWNLCRKFLDFFTKNLYRIPGNGKNTLLWDDKINVFVSLNSNFSLTEIKLWLTNKGLLRLSDLVSWEIHGN